MKLYQKYLVLILMVLLITIVYFYLQNRQEFINRVNSVLINLLDKQIEQEKSKAFSFALALSQNETLQTALQNKDSAKGYEILRRYMKTLETFSGSKVRTQIISKDFVIFARSWDNSDAGLNIKPYRPDLVEMSHTRYVYRKSIIDEAEITLHIKSRLSEGSTFTYIIKEFLICTSDGAAIKTE